MAQEIETKTVCIKADAMTEGGYLEGYASVKGDVDSYGDVIVDGAYANLEEFKRSGFMAVGHDHYSTPVGMIVDAKEDEKGLWVKAKFHNTAAAEEARKVAVERMEAGKDVGLSIGYIADEWEREKRGEDEVRLLKKIELREFSLVTMPAAKRALATSVKGETGSRLQEQFERLLDEATDLQSRMETFAKDRPNGLSEKNIERCIAVRDALDALVVKAAAPDGEDQPEIDEEALMLSLRSKGLI